MYDDDDDDDDDDGLDQRSCATSDPVSTRMGDRLWTGKPSRYVTSQLGQLSLLPSAGW